MPIYEFFCDECNTIFNFFSPTVNTTKKPKCPKCRKRKLSRRVSLFAVTGRAKEDDGEKDLPFDEGKMGRAMETLAREADRIDEKDPKQAADLMRKLTDMTGIEMGPQMREALRRMEAGEDPEQIEAEMGDLLEDEEPFLLPDRKGRKAGRSSPPPPKRDDTLYEL
jgi:putative FmdB family regulatory protein